MVAAEFYFCCYICGGDLCELWYLGIEHKFSDRTVLSA